VTRVDAFPGLPRYLCAVSGLPVRQPSRLAEVDTFRRLMRELGIRRVRRGARVRTTRADKNADRHPDLVKRQFTASGPNQLWVADLERHETFSNPAVLKGHRLRFVAANR
jgi:transposase InsO family protein